MEKVPDSVKNLQSARTHTNLLCSLDVCPVCLLRIAGELNPAILRNAADLVATHILPHKESPPVAVVEDDAPSKTRPTCPCCFGLLQDDFCNVSFLQNIIEFVKNSGYTMRTFWCSLTLPNSSDMRMRSFDEYWDQATVDGDPKYYKAPRLSVKDAWKAIVTPIFSSGFSAKWVGHEGLEVNLEIDHPEMEGECDVLKKRFSKSFQDKRGSDGKVKRTITRHALEKLLQTISSSEFHTLVPFPPKSLLKPAKLLRTTCIPCSLFLAGRYLKFSRCISQTPWFIEEERKGEDSVEELICKKISDRFQGESWRFLSSGREDIDVLCLGDGRPFGMELIGAKIAAIAEGDLIALEEDINKSTKDIEVRYLQMVSRKDMLVIKQGEEEKEKTYSALCQSEEKITAAELALLNTQKSIVINQRTPIRVLHRRVNAERSKTVMEMTAVAVENPFQFRLCLRTQAGTYIKEFIHGDFGRTEPSVSSMLGKEVECEELDVTCVDLAWPPSRINY